MYLETTDKSKRLLHLSFIVHPLLGRNYGNCVLGLDRFTVIWVDEEMFALTALKFSSHMTLPLKK